VAILNVHQAELFTFYFTKKFGITLVLGPIVTINCCLLACIILGYWLFIST